MLNNRNTSAGPGPLSITIDGQPIAATAGQRLIDLLNDAAVEVPHVCYHPQLGPIQTCDTCIVEINGELRRACAATVEAGMVVTTAADRLVEVRQEAMQRLLGNHELYCTVCDYNNGDCELHNAAARLDISHQKYKFTRKPYAVDDSNPFYRYDPDQCILCGRCVEACQNLQVTETLSINWEDPNPRVLWDGGAPINESSCVSCGHCVTVCPCNALMEKSMEGEAGYFTWLPDEVLRPAIEVVKASETVTGYEPLFLISDTEAAARKARIKRTKTVCTYCGVGCSFEIWTKGREILKVEPTVEGPANGVSTCVKGKFGWDYVNSDERLRKPLIRGADGLEEADWDDALQTVADRLWAIRQEHGPDSVAFIGSSKCTNEEAYLTQKIARAIFGTNSVDNCSRYCQAPATQGLWRTVGYGGDAGSISDIEQAEVVLIVGSNTHVSHPVLAARIRRAGKLNGQKLIVADLREHEMARRADIFLHPNPGTDLIWLSAVTKYILDQGWQDQAFLDRWVNDLDQYRASLEPFTLEFAAARTGLSIDQLKQTAELIAHAETVCGLWAMGVTQHSMGSNTSTAISNLLLVTGNYMRPGTGAYPLRGHNNVQGASDFGAINTYYTGYQKVEDEEIRAKFEKAWGVELPSSKGYDNREMIDAIHDGTIKALFVVGEELSLVDANANYVQDALRKLDFFVVQDIFMSRTADFADVVLAASPSLEKEGTFVNTERRVQRIYEVLEPWKESRPDWRILTDLAKAWGHDWGYDHPSEIMDEIADLTPMFAGVRYDRLAGFASLQWPVNADGTDTPLLYTDQFHFDDGKARLYPLALTEPSDQPNAEFNLHLNNGRLLEHFHTGNMTYKTPGIVEKVPDVFVEVSPALANERQLQSGDWVQLTSQRGSIEVRVQVSAEVRDSELYLPMHSRTHPINLLTSNVIDPDSHTPAYKEVAVRMQKLGRKDKPALGPNNPRFGNPTPQQGVEVERKWARADYRFPTADRPEDGKV
jgi:formate dehydrogenase major subunit